MALDRAAASLHSLANSPPFLMEDYSISGAGTECKNRGDGPQESDQAR